MFQVPSTIKKIQTLKDKTFKLSVECQELPADEMVKVFELNDKIGWLVFGENVIDKSDIPEENAPEFENKKSPSQRLRAILHVYWDKCTDKKVPFDTYYKYWTEKKITEIKGKLPKN